MGGTLLSAHAPLIGGPWTPIGDGDLAVLTGTGLVYDPDLTGSYGNAYLIGPTMATNREFVRAILHKRTGSTGDLGLILRGVAGWNGYVGEYDAISAAYKIWKVVAANYGVSPLAQVSAAWPDGTSRELRFEANGPNLRLLADGLEVLTASDGTYTAPGQPGWAAFPTSAPTLTTGWALGDWEAGYQ